MKNLCIYSCLLIGSALLAQTTTKGTPYDQGHQAMTAEHTAQQKKLAQLRIAREQTGTKVV